MLVRLLVLIAVPGFLIGQSISFLAPINTSVPQGFPSAASVVATDFNGDGKLEIAYYVSTPPVPSKIAVLFGNGDGTFKPGPSLVASAIGAPLTADFNGDGKADLFAIGTQGVLLNNGDGTFQAPVRVLPCVGTTPRTGDFNGDGKTDLICGTTVLLSSGDGTFQTGMTVDASAHSQVVLVADFNHDGKADLLLLLASQQLAVALGNGDGTFAADLPLTGVPNDFYGALAGDFNGDGKLDLAGNCTKAGLLCVTLGNGDGTFGTAIVEQGLFETPAVAADFNGDGKADVITQSGMVLASNGDGTFRGPMFIPTGNMVVGDFNGDGLPDIATAFRLALSSGISILLNDKPGDGFVTAGVSSPTLSSPIGPNSIASAFGTNLAPVAASASSTSALPTSLGGIRVHVTDSTGDSLAPLLYVSPTQINYVMTSLDPVMPVPESFAAISIEHVGSPYVPKGVGVLIEPFAPGFYSVGAGLAAASALRVAADYSETSVPVVSCGGTSCSLVPINVSGDPVYVSLYGTGFDQATAATTSCGVSGPGIPSAGAGGSPSGGIGISVPVTYAGPQMQTPGLDQLNLRLPKTLAGSGTVTITCSFDSVYVVYPANSVSIAIR